MTAQDVLNRSGFPFQLGVESAIRDTRERTRCDVLYREHPWSDADTGEAGFIDLVAVRPPYYFIIECKKLAPDSRPWVFVTDSEASRARYRARLLRVSVSRTDRKADWVDLTRTLPPSAESDFCAKHKDNLPSLERMSASLLQASTCYASEVMQSQAAVENYGDRTFIPIIVTNADLHFTRIDPRSVSWERGDLESVRTEPVDLIRFHKTLATGPGDAERAPTEQLYLFEAHAGRERTVLVCKPSGLMRLIEEIGIGV